MKRHPRERAHPSAAVLVILLLTSGLALAPATAGNSTHSPCLAVRATPPDATVDPACFPASQTQGQAFDVDPVIERLHVNVTWTYFGEIDKVQSFQIYRGATPATVDLVKVFAREDLPNEEGPWWWLDEHAVASGDSVWYRLVAIIKTGPGTTDFVQSEPELVRIGPTP